MTTPIVIAVTVLIIILIVFILMSGIFSNNAYDVGREDFRLGLELWDNPYTKGTFVYEQWIEGYTDEKEMFEVLNDTKKTG